jgi:hypothetical protein
MPATRERRLVLLGPVAWWVEVEARLNSLRRAWVKRRWSMKGWSAVLPVRGGWVGHWQFESRRLQARRVRGWDRWRWKCREWPWLVWGMAGGLKLRGR